MSQVGLQVSELGELLPLSAFPNLGFRLEENLMFQNVPCPFSFQQIFSLLLNTAGFLGGVCS